MITEEDKVYCRIASGKFQLEKLDEIMGIVEESIIPVLHERKGWQDFEVLADRDTGDFNIAVRWATKEDAVSVAEEGLVGELMGKVAHLFTGKPELVLREQIRRFSKD
ncbi:MAG: hypothetical protein ACW99U_06125 [Candidatus Thorarchaeota archaeon]|jgi:hypothetical protein